MWCLCDFNWPLSRGSIEFINYYYNNCLNFFYFWYSKTATTYFFISLSQLQHIQSTPPRTFRYYNTYNKTSLNSVQLLYPSCVSLLPPFEWWFDITWAVAMYALIRQQWIVSYAHTKHRLIFPSSFVKKKKTHTPHTHYTFMQQHTTHVNTNTHALVINRAF